MTDNRDDYDVLGVGKSASAAEIRRAFMRASLRHHPDKGGDPATFRRIREAYKTLHDPERRRVYDSGQQQDGWEKEYQARWDASREAAAWREKRARQREDDEREIERIRLARQQASAFGQLTTAASKRRRRE